MSDLAYSAYLAARHIWGLGARERRIISMQKAFFRLHNPNFQVKSEF